MARIARKTEEVAEKRYYNVVVTLIDGRTITATDVKAENKQEVFDTYAKDSIYNSVENILSITVIETE